jgi:hypothetical protein
MGDHEDWHAFRRSQVAERPILVRLRPTHAYRILELPPQSVAVLDPHRRAAPNPGRPRQPCLGWFDIGVDASRSRSRPTPSPIRTDPVATPPRPELAALGLSAGERVRWRNRPGGRWREGTVVERERDGSVGVRDDKGASRALRVDRLEVRTRGPRGARTWEPLTTRVRRTEQLPLFTGWDADEE